ncbi:rho-GDP dissociation inhibitor [Histoplasma ohiense]|uniref:Rho GDP-dissociation inhibitor n=2 Tax=Ajellomyces capsulatus TaxID=5037 RepID=A0A8H7ZC22_AJECA|nr:rho-GDP dissociation inhibitor [Histoplasma ohiense (nom. inval.)]KAG5304844.1 rho-GDP dissociation inhibitor [Histoplasma capsulatum]QSS53605.1 rho-GDP dissociation inhibitor [Histoplasma capsulatum var. duboisii H88]QSS75803.1 rho-GDP dissociation inhibitor [Histoplasma capsulatum G186AR]
MTNEHEDDLAASQTAGFKLGEKKTVEEYKQLDANDESLNRWKASLGLGTGTSISDPNDPRKCIIKSLALEVEGREDITIDLSAEGSVEKLKEKPFTIKEGCRFRIKATFVVQHEVLSGLKYIQVVKRKGVRLSKDEEMLGSYPPNTTDKPLYEKKFNPEEAPSGFVARGHYSALSRFVDDDDTTHLKFEWAFDIAKDW